MARSRLRLGEAIAGASGVLLFVAMFLPWYEIGGNLPAARRVPIQILAQQSGIDLNRTAWEAFTVIDLVLLAAVLAAVALVVLTFTQRAVALPVAMSVIVTLVGVVAAVLVLYRLIDEPGLSVAGGKALPDSVIAIRFWAYAGFVLTLGIAAGGFLSMADEGERLAAAEASPEPTTRPAPPRAGAGSGERPLAQ